MIQVQSAQIYSTSGAIAYQIDYSNGVSVRAVESRGWLIRKEHKTENGWLLSGKSYVIAHSRKRAAERIKQTVIEFVKGVAA